MRFSWSRSAILPTCQHLKCISHSRPTFPTALQDVLRGATGCAETLSRSCGSKSGKWAVWGYTSLAEAKSHGKQRGEPPFTSRAKSVALALTHPLLNLKPRRGFTRHNAFHNTLVEQFRYASE